MPKLLAASLFLPISVKEISTPSSVHNNSTNLFNTSMSMPMPTFQQNSENSKNNALSANRRLSIEYCPDKDPVEPLIAHESCCYFGLIRTQERQPLEVTECYYEEIYRKINAVIHCKPLNLSPNDYRLAINGYSNKTLLPILLSKQWSTRDIDHLNCGWEQYVQLNQIFASEILAAYEDGDIVLVFDYHLMLLPMLIRASLPTVPIGYLLDSPFPSSEFFRCLTHRRELLKGMLGSTLIGFQAYEFSRHFLSSCSRILGLESIPTGVRFNNSHITIGIFPLGINIINLRNIMSSDNFVNQLTVTKNSFTVEKIIFSIDAIIQSDIILKKLEAFEHFLHYTENRNAKIIFFQAIISDQITSDQNSINQQLIADAASRINSQFGSFGYLPVYICNHSLGTEERIAIMSIADLGFFSSDCGILGPFASEFVICQEQKHSPLIVSESTAIASFLGAAIAVNCWNIQSCARTFLDCLDMPEEERFNRHRHMFIRICQYDLRARSMLFVNGLKKLGDIIWHQMKPNVVNVEALKNNYSQASKRLILLDYDGTLVPIVSDPAEAIPSTRLSLILCKLSNDAKNSVYIISGRSQAFLQNSLSCPALGLSGEHGCFLKKPNSSTWETNIDSLEDAQWRESVADLFEHYTARTPGSWIEFKTASIAWHYRLADKDFGIWQSKQCKNHLDQVIVPKFPVEVIAGKKVLEVRPVQMNKGFVVKQLITMHPGVDFVLCAGDDRTDEDMFYVVDNECDRNAWTVLVGDHITNSAASFKIESPQKFVEVLEQLCIL